MPKTNRPKYPESEAELYNSLLSQAFYALRTGTAPSGYARQAFEQECRNRRHLYWQLMIEMGAREGRCDWWARGWYEWTLDYRPWLDGAGSPEDWLKALEH